MKTPFAEVMESSLSYYKAQTWKWDVVPQYGELVTLAVPTGVVYALVYQIYSGTQEPGRLVFPYQKTPAELLQEQPQIEAFLSTTFYAVPVGFEEQASVRYLTPLIPPLVHTPVVQADVSMSEKFYASPDYLMVLFQAAHIIPSFDEFVLAHLYVRARQQLLSAAQLQDIGGLYAQLQGADYRRLKLFLQRVQSLVH